MYAAPNNGARWRETALQPLAHADACTLHEQHPTSVAFFDEAGAISSDRFFVVGLFRVADHVGLLKDVKALRKRRRYWEEFKWATITAANANIYIEFLDLLVKSAGSYSAFVADRHVADPVARFGNSFAAYEKLATQLLIGSVRPYELVSVLADNYSAPNSRSFEATVRNETNSRLHRLAVVSVVQVDSSATEGLQLVDVLTGAVAFGFKADAGLASEHSHKGRVAKELMARLGVADLKTGHKSPDFRVNIYEHRRWLEREQRRLAIPPARSIPRTA